MIAYSMHIVLVLIFWSRKLISCSTQTAPNMKLKHYVLKTYFMLTMMKTW